MIFSCFWFCLPFSFHLAVVGADNEVLFPDLIEQNKTFKNLQSVLGNMLFITQRPEISDLKDEILDVKNNAEDFKKIQRFSKPKMQISDAKHQCHKYKIR